MSEPTKLTQSKPEDFLSDENLKKIVEIVDEEYSDKRNEIHMESISVKSKIKHLDNIVTLYTSVILVLLVLIIPVFFKIGDNFGFARPYVMLLLPALSIAYTLYSLKIKIQKQCIQQVDKTLSKIDRMKVNQDIEMHKKSFIEKIFFLLLIVSIGVLLLVKLPVFQDAGLKQKLNKIFQFPLVLVPTLLYMYNIAKLLDMKSFYEILEIVISDNIANNIKSPE